MAGVESSAGAGDEEGAIMAAAVVFRASDPVASSDDDDEGKRSTFVEGEVRWARTMSPRQRMRAPARAAPDLTKRRDVFARVGDSDGAGTASRSTLSRSAEISPPHCAATHAAIA